MEPKVLITKGSKDYELLDSGAGEKLERYGEYVLRRPDPQAIWNKNLLDSEWKNADAYFFRQGEKANWKKISNMPNEWKIELSGMNFNIKPTQFKHTGIFPEQSQNWKWIKEKIKLSKRPIKILNLFGYTGGATLAALSAGAEVTHVDSSKFSVEWAKENTELSGLKDKPVRWLIDDARKFVKREVKRGVKYDGIVMDPPTFGKGGEGAVWKIEEDLTKLLADCSQILSEKPLLFLINGYASGYSSQSYLNLIKPILVKYGGEFEIGELVIEEKSGRFLPAGIFARWSEK